MVKKFKKYKNRKLTFIDLFAGAGGLSEGFIKSGFTPIAHIEMNKDACLTLKTRIAYHYLRSKNKFSIYVSYLKGKITAEELYKQIPEDLLETVIQREISKKTINEIFGIIKNNNVNFGKDEIDLIIGGPPCQAYSNIGRSVDKNRMREDGRNYLYKMYARFLKEFNPKIFIFENVPGIKTARDGEVFKNLKKYFKRIGYVLEGKIINASDFGVLQYRKRLVIIGWRKDSNFQYPNFEKVEHEATINDVFKDLKSLQAGEVFDSGPYINEPTEYLSNYEIRNGLEFYTQHIARPHNENDLKIYELVINKWKNENIRLKYSDIPEKNRTQKNTLSFLDRFKVVNNDGLSHTIVAHISKDGHYYIHPDKSQLRSISVREAARIQSFPDDYKFEGSRTSIFKQIGNGVPPLMSFGISKEIKKMLER